MEPVTIGILGFCIAFVLAALRMPIALALAVVGVFGTFYIKGGVAFLYVLGTAPVEACRNYALSQVLLFLLMGAFASRGGMSYALFRAANAFIGHFRGGLAMATTVACGGFGAVCGSSLATVTTMSKICIPEMLRHNYSPRLAAGSVAAGGTLGILIPPSLLMIIYSYLTETSVGKLFAAGVIPGIVCILLYCSSIAISTRLNPDLGPASDKTPWLERIKIVKNVWGVVLLFVIVMGGIYFGFFSPTEGAGIGASGALLIGLIQRMIGGRGFVEVVRDTVNISAMVFFIIIGVSYFHFFMDSAEVPEAIADAIKSLDAPPFVIMCGIIVFLMFLGCVMDAIAIVFITTPFLFPIIVSLGFDPIWFGIMMVMVTEIGFITPPFGLNAFVIASMHPQLNVTEVFKGIFPFILADLTRVAIFLFFPQLVLWLPSLMVSQ